jgi:cephalosporin hydroxylase
VSLSHSAALAGTENLTGTELLECLLNRHGSDKATTHSYVWFYYSLLALREVKSVIELGVLHGGSLRAWRDYLPGAVVTGVDIVPISDVGEGITLVQGDAALPGILPLLPLRADLIIDDASHRLEHQAASFDLLAPRLSPGGAYVIEDIQAPDSQEVRDFALSRGLEAIDLRPVKGRYDDYLLVFNPQTRS